jgi:hypothetical protein
MPKFLNHFDLAFCEQVVLRCRVLSLDPELLRRQERDLKQKQNKKKSQNNNQFFGVT